jgi:hypothetical protein
MDVIAVVPARQDWESGLKECADGRGLMVDPTAQAATSNKTQTDEPSSSRRQSNATSVSTDAVATDRTAAPDTSSATKSADAALSSKTVPGEPNTKPNIAASNAVASVESNASLQATGTAATTNPTPHDDDFLMEIELPLDQVSYARASPREAA